MRRSATRQRYCTEPNGLAEGVVKTFKRDYVYLNGLDDAAIVIAQLPAWSADLQRIRAPQGAQDAITQSTS